MALSHDIGHLFGHLSFEKKGSEIANKASYKIVKLTEKMEERAIRVRTIRKENDLTDEDLLNVLSQARRNDLAHQTYVTSITTTDKGPVQKNIGVGVIMGLMAEMDEIVKEKAAIVRLGLMARNLISDSIYKLTFEELEALEF